MIKTPVTRWMDWIYDASGEHILRFVGSDKGVLDDIVNRINAHDDLVRAAEESNKDLVVTIGNIGAEIKYSTDPNAASRWGGVIDHLQTQVDANRAAITKSTQTEK